MFKFVSLMNQNCTLIRFTSTMEQHKEIKFKNSEWKPKVLVTHTKLPEEALNYLRQKCEVSFAKSNERDDILKKVKGVDGLLWASIDKLNAEVLDAAGPQLKSISVKSAGLDYVDVVEIKRRQNSTWIHAVVAIGANR